LTFSTIFPKMSSPKGRVTISVSPELDTLVFSPPSPPLSSIWTSSPLRMYFKDPSSTLLPVSPHIPGENSPLFHWSGPRGLAFPQGESPHRSEGFFLGIPRLEERQFLSPTGRSLRASSILANRHLSLPNLNYFYCFFAFNNTFILVGNLPSRVETFPFLFPP